MAACWQQVDDFEALLEPFTPAVSARRLPRTLAGDFQGLAERLRPRAEAEGGLLVLSEAMLREVTDADPRAMATLLDDLRRLEALGREPQLNVVTRYPRDERGLGFPVDVYSFHVDRAPVDADTFLCTYAGACSEGLEPFDAERLVDDPTLRAALRAHHGQDDGFEAFLAEGCFDLHYRRKPGAVPFSFGLGHLWRLAVASPGATAPPCIHRAPDEGGQPRLLLIA